MLASIVIRTLNEARYLEELLIAISNQELKELSTEVVIVDSGSDDDTLDIAVKYGCRITHIRKEDFTFGRSLNIGCDFADGDFFVFLSGHCIPVNVNWLVELVAPLVEGYAGYSYGRQIGRDATKFSERCLFDKYFPAYSKKPQQGFYCNNANAAVRKDVWEAFKFNESLTGLEDMYFAKALVASGGKVAYLAEAPVYHIHNESWSQIEVRYEREAFALQQIMPEVHLSVVDVVRYYCVGVFGDLKLAWKKGVLLSEFLSITKFRLMQYCGAYRGNHEHRKLSRRAKYRYFYPKDIEEHIYEKEENSRFAANEGKQRAGKGKKLP